MLKLTFKNTLLYIFVKYLLLYVFLMFKSKDYSLLNLANLKNVQDWFYYLWLILFMPIVSMILFSWAIYFTFKVKNRAYFVILLSLIFIAEYFVYVFFTSNKHIDVNGVINTIIGLILLILLFFKDVRSRLTVFEY